MRSSIERNPDGGVVALDLATRTGFAVWVPSCEIEYGHFVLPRTGDDVGRFLNEAKRQIWILMCKVNPLRSVVFEAPYVGTKTHQVTARKLMGLACVVEMLCSEFGIDCSEVNNASVRKHFTGVGRAARDEMKRLVLEEARARGYEPENDDEADAIAVLDFTLHALRETGDLPIGRLFKGMAA